MRCPTCHSSDVQAVDIDTSPVAVCKCCATVFLPELRENPAIEMCDDCAFRRGSPERADPYGWLHIIETTIAGGEPFYCHKGLTCELAGTTLTYLIPPGGPADMTPCAGWMSRRLAYQAGIPLSKL